jgi:exopolysaccharide biosynthesis polyprenyl glycosylphosphotransferase
VLEANFRDIENHQALQEPQKRSARPPRNTLRQQLVAGDAAALLSTWGGLVAARWDTGSNPKLAACAAAAVGVTLFSMRHVGLYRSRVCALRSLEAVRTLVSCGVGTAAFLLLQLLGMRLRADDALVAGAFSVVLVLVMRWRYGRWLRARRSASQHLRTVLLVGSNEDAEHLWTILSEEPSLGYQVGGVIGKARLHAPWGDLPDRPSVRFVPELANVAGANGVIVIASALSPKDREAAVRTALAAGLHVQLWPGAYGTSSRRTRFVPVSGVPMLYVEPRKVAPWQLAIKRASDLLIAGTIAVVTLPVMAITALAIKLSGDGPIIYRSRRVGKSGDPIDVLKFRTMVADAAQRLDEVAQLNERRGPLFKAANDPRVTKLGRWLRATSIDELPQLWNVLRGDMSMVGPRPALPHEVASFDEELNRRHEMRPGITGLWQVEARDNPSFNAYRRLDLSYVDDWSISLDVAILASTFHELTVRALRELFALLPFGRRRWARRATGLPSPVPLRNEPVVELEGLRH